MPIIKGDTDTLSRDAVLIEHLWEFEYIPPTEGVRTDEWKYFRCVEDYSIEELYNLREDPEETNNLANETDHQERLESLRATFNRLAEHYKSGQTE